MKQTGMTNTRVLAAVSGGADSMCMLHKLVVDGNDVVVAHYNHNMRGEESDRDAQFVSDYCKKNNIVCVIEKSAVILSGEENARKARYDFLTRTAKSYNCEVIATAHTKDDNAETVLLNLTRGTGTKGLCGIPYQRDNIVRPILTMSRKEVEQYNVQNNVPHVEDSSNESDDYSRNSIRHKVLPVLKEINPNVVDAIFRMSQLLTYDEDYLSSRPYEEHRAIASRYIRDNCPEPLSFSQVEAVLNLGKGYKMIDLPGIRVVKDRGKLYFSHPEISFDVTVSETIVNSNLTNDYLRYDSIIGDLIVSHRQPGDKFRVAGRNCTKTLKSLFLEANLNQSERDAWPVLRDSEGIVWVYKLGLAERVVCKPGDRAYKISVVERNENA